MKPSQVGIRADPPPPNVIGAGAMGGDTPRGAAQGHRVTLQTGAGTHRPRDPARASVFKKRLKQPHLVRPPSTA